MTTWVNSQFPRLDFHRQVQRHYGLQNSVCPHPLVGDLARSAYASYFMKAIHYVPLGYRDIIRNFSISV
jgi:hypothetical protein